MNRSVDRNPIEIILTHEVAIVKLLISVNYFETSFEGTKVHSLFIVCFLLDCSRIHGTYFVSVLNLSVRVYSDGNCDTGTLFRLFL